MKAGYYIINSLTIYRLVAAPILLVLLFYDKLDLFRWLIAFSFFTDFIDGILARTFKVSSVLGARMDSLADDLNMLVAIIALIVVEPEFFRIEIIMIGILVVLYLFENILAFIKYRRTTAFHCYSAKAGALFQAIFFIAFFFTLQVSTTLFYIAAVITAINLFEEIVLVLILPEWKTNVKGLLWVLRRPLIPKRMMN